MAVRKPFLLICSFFFAVLVKAQDPHFSQFFASPLTLNPALTGKFDGILRFAANHRDQWPSIPKAYVTTSASLDIKLLRNKLSENDVLGFGVSGVSDQSADNALKLNYGSVSLSYHKALDEDGHNTFGVGFQGTYSSMMLDMSKLTFEDQITENGFTNPTSESLPNGSKLNYFDVNAGILYCGSTDGNNSYYIGASMYHLNKPLVGFVSQFWQLSPRYTVHGGGSLPLTDRFTLHGSIIHQIQNKANETIFGAAIAADLNSNDASDNPTNIYVGLWHRLNDAIIPYTGIEFGGFQLGISYDVNISTLKPASQSKGGGEVSLIYIKRPTEKGKDLPCPKF